VKNKDATKRFQQADRLFREGRYKEALYILNLLDESFPNDRHILWPKAMCLTKLGRRDDAIALLQRIVDEFDYPKAKDLLLQLAREQHDPAQPEASRGTSPGTPAPDAMAHPDAFNEDRDSFDLGEFTPSDLDASEFVQKGVLTPANKAAISPVEHSREIPWGIVATATVGVIVVVAAVVLFLNFRDASPDAPAPQAESRPSEQIAEPAPAPQEPAEPYPGASTGNAVIPQPEWTDEQLAAWFQAYEEEWPVERRRELNDMRDTMSPTEKERYQAAYRQGERVFYGVSTASEVDLGAYAWMDTWWANIIMSFLMGYVWQWPPIFLILLIGGHLTGDSWFERLRDVSLETLIIAILQITCIGYIVGVVMLGRKHDWSFGEYALYILFSIISLAVVFGLGIMLGLAVVFSSIGFSS